MRLVVFYACVSLCGATCISGCDKSDTRHQRVTSHLPTMTARVSWADVPIEILSLDYRSRVRPKDVCGTLPLWIELGGRQMVQRFVQDPAKKAAYLEPLLLLGGELGSHAPDRYMIPYEMLQVCQMGKDAIIEYVSEGIKTQPARLGALLPLERDFTRQLRIAPRSNLNVVCPELVTAELYVAHVVFIDKAFRSAIASVTSDEWSELVSIDDKAKLGKSVCVSHYPATDLHTLGTVLLDTRLKCMQLSGGSFTLNWLQNAGFMFFGPHEGLFEVRDYKIVGVSKEGLQQSGTLFKAAGRYVGQALMHGYPLGLSLASRVAKYMLTTHTGESTAVPDLGEAVEVKMRNRLAQFWFGFREVVGNDACTFLTELSGGIELLIMMVRGKQDLTGTDLFSIFDFRADSAWNVSNFVLQLTESLSQQSRLEVLNNLTHLQGLPFAGPPHVRIDVVPWPDHRLEIQLNELQYHQGLWRRTLFVGDFESYEGFVELFSSQFID